MTVPNIQTDLTPSNGAAEAATVQPLPIGKVGRSSEAPQTRVKAATEQLEQAIGLDLTTPQVEGSLSQASTDAATEDSWLDDDEDNDYVVARRRVGRSLLANSSSTSPPDQVKSCPNSTLSSTAIKFTELFPKRTHTTKFAVDKCFELKKKSNSTSNPDKVLEVICKGMLESSIDKKNYPNINTTALNLTSVNPSYPENLRWKITEDIEGFFEDIKFHYGSTIRYLFDGRSDAFAFTVGVGVGAGVFMVIGGLVLYFQAKSFKEMLKKRHEHALKLAKIEEENKKEEEKEVEEVPEIGDLVPFLSDNVQTIIKENDLGKQPEQEQRNKERIDEHIIDAVSEIFELLPDITLVPEAQELTEVLSEEDLILAAETDGEIKLPEDDFYALVNEIATSRTTKTQPYTAPIKASLLKLEQICSATLAIPRVEPRLTKDETSSKEFVESCNTLVKKLIELQADFGQRYALALSDAERNNFEADFKTQALKLNKQLLKSIEISEKAATSDKAKINDFDMNALPKVKAEATELLATLENMNNEVTQTDDSPQAKFAKLVEKLTAYSQVKLRLDREVKATQTHSLDFLLPESELAKAAREKALSKTAKELKKMPAAAKVARQEKPTEKAIQTIAHSQLEMSQDMVTQTTEDDFRILDPETRAKQEYTIPFSSPEESPQDVFTSTMTVVEAENEELLVEEMPLLGKKKKDKKKKPPPQLEDFYEKLWDTPSGTSVYVEKELESGCCTKSKPFPEQKWFNFTGSDLSAFKPKKEGKSVALQNPEVLREFEDNKLKSTEFELVDSGVQTSDFDFYLASNNASAYKRGNFVREENAAQSDRPPAIGRVDASCQTLDGSTVETSENQYNPRDERHLSLLDRSTELKDPPLVLFSKIAPPPNYETVMLEQAMAQRAASATPLYLTRPYRYPKLPHGRATDTRRLTAIAESRVQSSTEVKSEVAEAALDVKNSVTELKEKLEKEMCIYQSLVFMRRMITRGDNEELFGENSAAIVPNQESMGYWIRCQENIIKNCELAVVKEELKQEHETHAAALGRLRQHKKETVAEFQTRKHNLEQSLKACEAKIAQLVIQSRFLTSMGHADLDERIVHAWWNKGMRNCYLPGYSQAKQIMVEAETALYEDVRDAQNKAERMQANVQKAVASSIDREALLRAQAEYHAQQYLVLAYEGEEAIKSKNKDELTTAIAKTEMALGYSDEFDAYSGFLSKQQLDGIVTDTLVEFLPPMLGKSAYRTMKHARAVKKAVTSHVMGNQDQLEEIRATILREAVHSSGLVLTDKQLTEIKEEITQCLTSEIIPELLKPRTIAEQQDVQGALSFIYTRYYYQNNPVDDSAAGHEACLQNCAMMLQIQKDSAVDLAVEMPLQLNDKLTSVAAKAVTASTMKTLEIHPDKQVVLEMSKNIVASLQGAIKLQKIQAVEERARAHKVASLRSSLEKQKQKSKLKFTADASKVSALSDLEKAAELREKAAELSGKITRLALKTTASIEDSSLMSPAKYAKVDKK